MTTTHSASIGPELDCAGVRHVVAYFAPEDVEVLTGSLEFQKRWLD